MLTSTLHRISGLGLAIGSILLVVWVCAAAAGGGTFESVNAVYASWYGHVLLFCWTLTLFYHLCSGIRYLVWDTGRGFEIKTAETASYVVFAAAVVLTVIAWVWALAI